MTFLPKKNITIFAFFILYAFAACKKEKIQKEEETPQPPTVQGTDSTAADTARYKLTYFSGPANSQSDILFKMAGQRDKVEIYHYGPRDASAKPVTVTSIVLKRTGSDTLFNFILDDLSRIKLITFEVQGVPQPKVQRFTYAANDSVYHYLYEYNWNNHKDSLIAMTGVALKDGKYNATVIYGTRPKDDIFKPNWKTLLLGVERGAGVLLSVATAYGGIAFFNLHPATAALLAIYVAYKWGDIVPNSGASTVFPPPGAGAPQSPQVKHVPTPTSVPSPTVGNPCAGVNMTFTAELDDYARISIKNASGGQAPYLYSVNNSAFQAATLFNGPYTPGVFNLTVKDANGCTSSKSMSLSPPVSPTITIGTQVWMKENLYVNQLNDGTPIAIVNNGVLWDSLPGPGACWYNNDAATHSQKKYGMLYNWYTVNTGKLCPVGFHVPSDAEWNTLVTYLGGASVAGGKLKELGLTNWAAPNTGATDDAGFRALPAGMRFQGGGQFNSASITAAFWTSSASGASQAIRRMLSSSSSAVTSTPDIWKTGCSVRCIKD